MQENITARSCFHRIFEDKGKEEEENSCYIKDEEKESKGVIANIVSVPPCPYGFLPAFVSR